MKVLITGGAGFIGRHLAQALLGKGVAVSILDNFSPQIHGQVRELPSGLAGRAQISIGDVADLNDVAAALDGVDRVVHLAAETGTGQSMYEVARYSRTNLQGTAQLFDLLVKQTRRIDRFVIASSRAIYGEGAYECSRDGIVYPKPRTSAEKQSGLFDPLCPVCQGPCFSVPTPESAPAQPSSFYGLTKLTQEQMALLFGEVLGIPTIALRYQNVYGPGQSLSNPYTGILAIFSNLAREGKQIRVFEDGEESRDFVYIEDVVRATEEAALGSIQGCHSINIGSGARTTVLEVATKINEWFGGRSALTITGAFREGDIRHGMADLSLAKKLLRYVPSWNFDAGLREFLSWTRQNETSSDAYEISLREMRERGLLHG